MRLCLLTTTDVKGSRASDVQALIDTIATERAQGVEATLWLLLQNCDGAACAAWQRRAPDFVRVSAVAGRLSLSGARNRLLDTLPAGTMTDQTIIAFPDDDCWYPAGFLAGLARLFDETDTLDLFVCRFAPDPVAWTSQSSPPAPAAFHQIVRMTSSNSMFMRGRLVPPGVRFDELLGLGARFNGGEDTDFVIRAFLLARAAWVSFDVLIGHPATSMNTLGKYYRGTALAIAKHARKRPVIMREFLRKLAVGVVLLLRREVQLADFAPALRQAAGRAPAPGPS